MKYRILFLLTTLIFLSAYIKPLSAQGFGRGRGQQWGKLDNYEKLKMIDELNMSEETSVKFFARRSDFKKRQRSYNRQIDSLVTEMKEYIKAGKEQSGLKKYINDYLLIENYLMKSRQDYINSMSDILTTEQIGKYLIFEKMFRVEIQEMMMRRGGGRNLQQDE